MTQHSTVRKMVYPRYNAVENFVRSRLRCTLYFLVFEKTRGMRKVMCWFVGISFV